MRSLNVSLVERLCANNNIFLSSPILLAHSTKVVVFPAPATACTIRFCIPFLQNEKISSCSLLKVKLVIIYKLSLNIRKIYYFSKYYNNYYKPPVKLSALLNETERRLSRKVLAAYAAFLI